MTFNIIDQIMHRYSYILILLVLSIAAIAQDVIMVEYNLVTKDSISHNFGTVDLFEDSGATPSRISDEDLRPQIHELVAAIANANIIDSASVGYSGEQTVQYGRFELLYKSATLSECLALTYHENAVVRGYAFWGLAKKHYKDIEAVFDRFSDDKTIVLVFQGCLGDQVPLSLYARWVVTPQMFDSDCKKLASLRKE